MAISRAERERILVAKPRFDDKSFVVVVAAAIVVVDIMEGH